MFDLNRHFHCIFLEGVYLDRPEVGGSRHVLSQVSRPPMPILLRSSRRSAIGPCASSASWDTWRLASMRLWPPIMIPCALTPPS